MALLSDRPDYVARTKLLDTAQLAIAESRSRYREGKEGDAQLLSELGLALADIATSVTPIVGWGKDFYEAYTGRGLLSDRRLSEFDRTLAIVGVLTAGIGSKFSLAGKAGVIFKVLSQTAEEAGDVVGLAKAVDRSTGILDSAKTFTDRLTPGKIRDYLSKVDTIPRENLIADMESIGLTLKGSDRSRPFLEFVDQHGRIRSKIHPPDKATEYHHLHIYDKDGNPMTSALEVIAGKKGYKSPDAHIEIMGP